MATEFRKTGIDVVGDSPWGTHFCHFYETKQDLFDTLVPYFKAGLESKEFCLWVVSDSELITVEEAKGALAQAVPDLDRHLSDENIEILNGLDWYLEKNVLNLERVTNAWGAKLKQALARGYDGLRASGDTFWLAEKDWKDFCAYEKQVNDWITDQPMTVLCTYPLAKSGAADVLDVAKTHQFAIARRQGEWEIIESPELVQAKAEIRRLNEDLEQRVIERTNELRVANEELRKEIAERNQAEDEVRQQKEILQQIFDHIPVMINFVGADGRIKLVNREWERTLGWSLEEIRQQNLDVFAECYPDPQYRQQVLKFVAEAKGRWADFKTRVRDGRVMDTTWVRVHLSDGTSIGIGKDITERKQAEEALDERLRFETLVTELSAAFANLSPNEVDREIDKWLETLVEFLGVDRASFFQFEEDWTTLYRSHSYTVPGIEALPPPPIGMKDQFPWITEQLRQGITVKWARIPDDMPEEAVKEKEYAARLGVKSGLNIPVRMGGSVICAITFTSTATYRDWPDAMVARLRLVGEIFAAAVERKRAEAALRKSEEQFRQMAENIREVFWLTTGDLSKLLYVSPAYEAVWGQSRESLYQEPRSFYATIHAEDRSRVIAIVETEREQGFEVEYRVVRPDGSIRWIRDRGFPIHDESGRFYRLAGIAEDITEHMDAEALLHAKEQEFRAIVENAPDQIIRYDREFRRTYVNPAVTSAYGLPAEALIGKPIGSVIQDAGLDVKADELAQIRQHIASVFETGKPCEYEITWPLATGRRYFSSRMFPELDRDGSVINVLGIARDITERKQAEDVLRRSEDHLRLVLDTTPALIHTGRPDGYLDYFNQRWLKYVGRSLEELQGWGWTATIHPDDVEGIVNEWRASLASGEPFQYEARVRQADGEYRWMLHRKVPLRDEHGNIVKWHGSSIDIEDRKQAEEKLKQSESQLAEAQHLAHVGSFDWDLRSNAVTWSDELYRIFGLQPGEINVAGDAMSFIHPEDRDLVLSTINSSIKNKEPYSFYYRVLRPDGNELIVHSRGHVVTDEEGDSVRVFGATEDVTDLKRTEEKLKATSDQLRALSARLQSVREEESTRIAREIHDELGSSLTRLKWDLELIRKEDLGTLDEAELAKLGQRIDEMIQLMDATVDTVRRISAELRPSVLDDLGLIAALRWQTNQFRERTGIETNFDSSLENIDLTPPRSTAVFRVFEEALTNVMRHARATRVAVKLDCDAGHLVLTIRDNGRGITVAEKTDRLSLGLLSMRERVNMIGGQIDITGNEAEGTIVTVRLPIAGGQ